MKEGLNIIDNRDKGTITIKSKELGLDIELPLAEFAKLSVKHLRTGIKMSELLKKLKV